MARGHLAVTFILLIAIGGPEAVAGVRPPTVFKPGVTVISSDRSAGKHTDLQIDIHKRPDEYPSDKGQHNEQDFKSIEMVPPPGLVISLQSLPNCNLLDDHCTNPESIVGTGHLDAQVWLTKYQLHIPEDSIPVKIHNEKPEPGEIARMVIIVDRDDAAFIPGLALPLSVYMDRDSLSPVLRVEIPNYVPYKGNKDDLVNINISRISLDIKSIGERGSPFINPTSFEQRPFNVTLGSYGKDNKPSTDDRTAFFSLDYPTGGSNVLGFSPSWMLSATPLTPLGRPAVNVALSMKQGEAAVKEATISLPRAFRFNPDRTSDYCSAQQAGNDTCPGGSWLADITVSTRMLSRPLAGSSYIGEAQGNTMPVYTIIRDPVNLRMSGWLRQREDNGLDLAVGLPDLPVDGLQISMPGGQKAPFMNPAQCGEYAFKGTFVGHNGAISQTSGYVTIQGCAIVADQHISRAMRVVIKPRKPGKRARLYIKLLQDPATKLKRARFTIDGKLNWALKGHSKRAYVAILKVEDERGVTREYELYPRSYKGTRLVLRTRGRKNPYSLTVVRSGSNKRRAIVEAVNLPDVEIGSLGIDLIGGRRPLLRTPKRCLRGIKIRAYVTDRTSNTSHLVGSTVAGCPGKGLPQ